MTIIFDLLNGTAIKQGENKPNPKLSMVKVNKNFTAKKTETSDLILTKHKMFPVEVSKN